MERKLAAVPSEYAAIRTEWPDFDSDEALDAYLTSRDLKITVWSAEDIGATEGSIGLAGSPTQVHKVNFVVLEGGDSKTIAPTPQAIAAMVAELVHEYIVG